MHRESQEINDPVWDCTLIKVMKDKGDTVVNPIYEWTDEDVWDYIKQKNLKVNPLYERGYKRVGCIGCPLATYRQKLKGFADYPQYKKAYINAFQKMLDKGISEGKDYSRHDLKWIDGQGVFEWWIEEGKHNVKGQMNLFEEK